MNSPLVGDQNKSDLSRCNLFVLFCFASYCYGDTLLLGLLIGLIAPSIKN